MHQKRSTLCYVIALTCTYLTTTNLHAQILSLPGWQAQLSDNSSVGITGTVTIVDQFTLEFEDFSYNGTGGGETDIVLVPFGNGVLPDRPFGVGERFNALADFFFTEQPGSVTVLDDIRSIDPTPGFPSGGDSPPITNADFTLTVTRDNFEAGAAGDAEFQQFINNGGLLGFSTISVYCHPFDFDFGSGVFLPPADPNADFNQNGTVDGTDFLSLQRNFGAADPNFTGNFPGDANSDNVVNSADLSIFEAQFGTAQEVPGPLPPSFFDVFPNFFDNRSGSFSSSLAQVPEPASWTIALATTAVMAFRRKRQSA